MTNKAIHIVSRLLSAFAVVAAALFMQGCSGSDEPKVDPGSEEVMQLGFRVRLSEKRSAARSRTAANFSGYEHGKDYENYIAFDEHDFVIMLFGADDNYIETLYMLSCTPQNVAEGDEDKYDTEYYIICPVTRKVEGAFKVVILANWGGGPYAQTFNGLFARTYAYSPVFTPSERTPIPMYGVATVPARELEPDKVNDIGGIDLIRAMAKIEVICANEGSELALHSVTLSRANSKGFCAPAGMNEVTGYVNNPSIPGDATILENLSFTVAGDKKSAVIYVPEYDNITMGVIPCKLSVTFDDNPEAAYEVEFRNYRDGKPEYGCFDILRNCIYRFTVDKQMEFSVEVIPYTIKDLAPEFGV